MTIDAAKYKKLKDELDALQKLADDQTHHYRSARQLLYEGLSRVYLWWREASKEADLLEQLYSEYDIQYKKETMHEIVFTPLLRYLWNMDGTVNSNTLDQWNRALNNIHIEVQNNKELYKANPLQKLVSLISNKGGITALAGYEVKIDDDNTASKNKISKSAEQKLHDAHLHNGKQFFATSASPLASFTTRQTLPSSDSGFTLALIRKGNKGYEVLGAIDDKALVEQAVVAAYKRTSEQMPNTARLLTEVIRTQTFPSKIAKLASEMADDSKYFEPENNKKRMKQLKRVLYVAKDNAFVLSANRSDCSVVTVAKPFCTMLETDCDVALAVNDRTYIENNLIHTGDFNFYTADAAVLVPATQDEAASHKLKLENTVTKKFRFVRFYPLSAYNFAPSKTQAIVKSALVFKPTFTATLDAKWLGEMNALFLARWVNGYGAKLKRHEHKLLKLSLAKTSIAFGYNYKGDDFREAEIIDLASKAKGYLEVNVLSKDIVPVLNALVQVEVDGDVELKADDKMLQFAFKTESAEYVISVPCCTSKAKRIADYFEAYGA